MVDFAIEVHDSFLRRRALHFKEWSSVLKVEINPTSLYKVAYFATQVAMIHPVTVYQSIAGIKSFALPRHVRLGRSIRFRGSDILVWIEGLKSDKKQSSKANPDMTRPSVKRGAPTKEIRIARRIAGMGGAR